MKPTSEKFDNGLFTLKTESNVFPKILKNATITGHFGFVFNKKTVPGKSPDNPDVIVFGEPRFQNVFHAH